MSSDAAAPAPAGAPRNPGPWTLSVLEHFRQDPIINLGRTFPPTHALVHGVYLGCDRPETAIIEFELIDGPPPPIQVAYKGSFEDETFDTAGSNKRLPWFPFTSETTFDVNAARLLEHVRDSLALHGPKGKAPACAEEPEDRLYRSGEQTRDARRAFMAPRPPPEPPLPPPPPGFREEPSRPSNPGDDRRAPPARPHDRRSDRPRRSSAPPPARSSSPGRFAPARAQRPDPLSAPTLVTHRHPSKPPLPPEPPPLPEFGPFAHAGPRDGSQLTPRPKEAAPLPNTTTDRPPTIPPPPPVPPRPEFDDFD